ncbi:cyp-43A1, partial [Pristionchus pacificus]
LSDEKGSLIQMILLLTIIFFLFIIYSILHHNSLVNRLKENGFVTVPSLPLLGNEPILSSPNSFKIFGQLAKTYGKTYALLRGSVPTVITSDPTVIREICIQQFSSFHSHALDPLDSDIFSRSNLHLFHSRGSKWKRLRTAMSSAFSLQAMRGWFTKMEERTDELVDNLPLDRPVSLHHLFQLHASSVIAECSFDGDEEGKEEWKGVVNFFGAPSTFFTLSTVGCLFPSLTPFLISFDRWRSQFNPPNPLANFTRFIAKTASLRDEDQSPSDFLQYLKRVEVDEGEIGDGMEDHFDPTKSRAVKTITVNELPSQLRFVSIAGFDTTANTLTFLCLLLAEHQEIQETIRSMVSNLSANIDTLSSLPYLQWCIWETLRLYPHASPLSSRECTSHITLSNGLHFDKGTQVILNTWSLHYDPSLWTDPLQFRPERFSDSSSLFIPFGLGPRQCIGMRFALLEIKLAIVRLLQRYRIHRVEESTVSQLHPSLSSSLSFQCRLSVRDTNTIWPDGISVRFESL